jgi:2-keto-4-pentenoate hydratase/2-oxohepta-3-ene-1,7-dioic acid hydratase in catechol pathway
MQGIGAHCSGRYRGGVRIARFSVEGSDPSFGVVETVDRTETIATMAGHPFASFGVSDIRRPLADVRLLAPILPTKIVAVGKNYAEHAAEMGGTAPQGRRRPGDGAAGDPPAEPLIFLKPSTAVIGPADPIGYPRQSERVDFEGELAVVVGRVCRDVDEQAAYDAILGYTCANDVTARDLQARDGQWSRAKGFDSFCPLGPWIETDLDPADVAIATRLNGDTRQQARTSELLHPVAKVLAYVSSAMTLLPGDVVLTGTPAGVGPMRPGDEVTVAVEGVGTLTNPVVQRG